MSKFKYYKFKNYYICADQTLDQAIKTISHIWNSIQTEPPHWTESRMEQIIYLEKWGNYCKMSNFSDNYKIFDFDKRVVTKYIIASPVVVKKEVDRLKKSSVIKQAPKIINSCESEGWYEEEYIFGTELWPNKWSEVREIYKKYIFNIIDNIVKNGDIKKIDPVKYSTINNKVLCNISNYSNDINTGLVKTIVNFSNTTLEKIEKLGINRNILLTCTHGDFKFSHIIISDSGSARVIDWETYGKRSLLFDFFNPLGPWLIHNIDSFEESTEKDFQNLLHAFDANISSTNLINEGERYIEKNIILYSLVYYLERLVRILEVNNVIDNTNINNVIRAIDGFKKIDKLLNN
jgi:thiamine kinase-like enzyme